MTDDEIIQMLDWHAATTDHSSDGLLARIKRVVREAERREREACANVCDDHFKLRADQGFPRESSTARNLRDVIRARSEP